MVNQNYTVQYLPLFYKNLNNRPMIILAIPNLLATFLFERSSNLSTILPWLGLSKKRSLIHISFYIKRKNKNRLCNTFTFYLLVGFIMTTCHVVHNICIFISYLVTSVSHTWRLCQLFSITYKFLRYVEIGIFLFLLKYQCSRNAK